MDIEKIEELRRQGLSWRAIGEKLGVSHEGARKAVRAARDRPAYVAVGGGGQLWEIVARIDKAGVLWEKRLGTRTQRPFHSDDVAAVLTAAVRLAKAHDMPAWEYARITGTADV